MPDLAFSESSDVQAAANSASVVVVSAREEIDLAGQSFAQGQAQPLRSNLGDVLFKPRPRCVHFIPGRHDDRSVLRCIILAALQDEKLFDGAFLDVAVQVLSDRDEPHF